MMPDLLNIVATCIYIGVSIYWFRMAKQTRKDLIIMRDLHMFHKLDIQNFMDNQKQEHEVWKYMQGIREGANHE